MVKYCPKCGNASYNSAAVCGNCGYDFNLGSAEGSTGKGKSRFKPASNDNSQNDTGWERKGKKTISKDYDPIYLTDKEKYELFKSSKESDNGYQTLTTKKDKDDTSYTIIPTNEDKKDDEEEYPSLIEEVKSVFEDKKSEEEVSTNQSVLNKISRRTIGIFVIIIIALAIIVAAGGLIESGNHHQSTPILGPGNYTSADVVFSFPTNWTHYNSTSGESNQGEIAFRTGDGTVIGFSCVNNSKITLNDIKNSINHTAHSLKGKIISVENITINGENATDIVINTTGHGYSRYICVIHDNTYYTWVINNHKSENLYLSAVYTPEINKMIESIHFI